MSATAETIRLVLAICRWNRGLESSIVIPSIEFYITSPCFYVGYFINCLEIWHAVIFFFFINLKKKNFIFKIQFVGLNRIYTQLTIVFYELIADCDV